MSWTADVVNQLARHKRAGLEFNEAWKLTLRLYPPRGRDWGEYRPTLLPEPGAAESMVEFFRRCCDDAWHGRRPSLRHFSAQVMHDAVLDSTEAGAATVRRRNRSIVA